MRTRTTGYTGITSSRPRAILDYEYRKVAPTSPPWVWTTEYREVLRANTPHSYYCTNYRSIQDEVLGKTRANPCVHNRPGDLSPISVDEFEFKAAIGGSTTWTKYGEKRYYSQEAYDIATWSNGTIESILPSLPAIPWLALVGDAGSQISGRLASSSNILVELCQVASTVKMLKHPFQYRDIMRFRRKLLSLRNLAKTSANAWLEWKYGWKNLWYLYRDLSQALPRARDHYNYLQMSAGRFTHVGSSNISNVAWSGLLPYQVGNYATDHSCLAQADGYSVNAHFGFDVIRPSTALHYSIMDLMVQGLGSDDILGALWDLTPFSFVADWFIGLDKWLQRDPVFLSSFNLRRTCYSTEVEYYAKPKIRQRIYTPTGNSTYPYTEWTGDRKCIYKRYTRYPGFPSGTGASNWDGLKTSQLLDGAALIVQRL